MVAVAHYGIFVPQREQMSQQLPFTQAAIAVITASICVGQVGVDSTRHT
jgi:hypothetical protein